MEQVYRCDKSGMTALLIVGLGAERDKAEQETVEAGIPVPISHRAAWAANLYQWEPWFLLVRDANGRACAGVGIEQSFTRAMPGHKILRLRRFGHRLPTDACRVVLQALSVLAREDPRILRVQVQVFSRKERSELSEILASLGFRELPSPTVYRHTLIIDLKPSEEEIFAKINESGRNKIRKTVRKSGRCVVIDNPIYADRIGELQDEAVERTNGHIHTENWRAVLTMSRQRPELSQVFGMFVGEDDRPENMAAFGWVCNHGDHCEYRAAGSTRRTDLKMPYGYLVTWDMIRWAKAAGAEWFDLGGVSLGNGDQDPLRGISDFKRSFSREVADVGAEWVLEPHPLRARIADEFSNAARLLRSWKSLSRSRKAS